MILTVFRSRLRVGVDSEYDILAAQMSELARAMEGFIDESYYESASGERVTIVRFADRASHDAWAAHPRHREAQRRGREEFYTFYNVTVAVVTDERHVELGP